MSEENESVRQKLEKDPRSPQEPSVLDWVKSVFRLRPLPIPEEGEAPALIQRAVEREDEVQERWSGKRLLEGITAARLRLPVALFLALIAQFGLEQRRESIGVSVALYLLSALIIAWAVWVGDFEIKALEPARRKARTLAIRPLFLLVGLFFAAATFLASSNNRFTLLNVSSWLLATVFVVLALWEGDPPLTKSIQRFRKWLAKPKVKLTFDGWALAVALGFGISLFFRFADLASLPPEMVSDHAEKLLDVVDILNGKYSIFFPRNTGREALQFYMGAAAAKWLGLGISYMTLKVGTVLAGLITIPYIYLLGKEVGGKEVGLAAMVLAGIGYWPNVISRVGLRFPLYPLFVAPALYYLVRGLRRKQVNDFLICGVVIGIGLHGYSPARVIPLVVTMGVAVYLLHRRAAGQRWAVMTWLIAAGILAFVIFLPLFRIALDRPDDLLFRTVTRIGGTEKAIEGNPVGIFISNVWRGLTMFGWDNGEVWVNSIPHRPAFDWITAALFHIGVVIVFLRWIKERNWVDLFLLLSIPLLQLPSTLAIAFPAENPATNRAAGAFVPGFVIAGTAMTALPALARQQWKENRQRFYAFAIIVLLFVISAGANFNLVFDEYAELYRKSAWNTSDAGRIIQAFAESVGTYDTAHVVAYAHWMDTRLIGIQAGRPTIDYAIWPEDFDLFLEDPRSMLFILNPRDEEALDKLKVYFPDGTVSLKRSLYEGKDLILYFVPSDEIRGTLPSPE